MLLSCTFAIIFSPLAVHEYIRFKQVEADVQYRVKSSLHSNNLKNSLVGNFIKSKLYLLILLTFSTGGIFIGNIIVPELTPPAQAQARSLGAVLKILSRGEMAQKVVKIRSGQRVKWFCELGGYGSIEEHTVQFGRKLWKLNYNNPLELSFSREGRYKYFVDGVPYYIVVSR